MIHNFFLNAQKLYVLCEWNAIFKFGIAFFVFCFRRVLLMMCLNQMTAFTPNKPSQMLAFLLVSFNMSYMFFLNDTIRFFA